MKKEYYQLDTKEIINQLKSNQINGLNNEEVLKRQHKYGLNILPQKRNDTLIKIFFQQMLDPIVLLLIITVVFSFVTKETTDAIVIIFIILVDLIMGTFQEWKAEKNASSLQNLIEDKATVIRNNEKIVISSKKIVIGDIILLESGDKISADARIIEQQNLQLNESILTGESLGVYKNNEVINVESILTERKNMIYAGSSVISGRGKAIVCSTSLNTEIGKIANQVINMPDEKSPLTIRVEKLSRQISFLVIITAIIIATLLWYKNVSGKEIFLAVIALAVSAMPEGLPLALTMALSITSNQMAKKNVICKKLNSVESLGSCSVIATDKTGTLTVNEQTAKKVTFPNGEEVIINGSGYNFNGTIDCPTSVLTCFKKLTIHGTLNNESSIIKKGKNYNYYGDSIDLAFLIMGRKANIEVKDYHILATIPYESENKYSATFYEYKKEIYCTIKGSLETILNFSKLNKKTRAKIINQNEQLSMDGYRVIAIASSKIPDFSKKEYYTEKDIPKLEFEGLVSFIDPIRTEAKSAIKECKNAGIKVIMITGDHPLTALSIAKDLDLAKDLNDITTGSELTIMFNKGAEVFDEFIKNKKVFARVTPTDKLNIVNSLKRQGEFVAVTGDGVNDAPAIKSANIGIAMGSGTDVAKETANMIITDDNFKSIVSGIKLGRTAYSNIRKICYFLLSCGLAEVLFFLLSILFDLPMPLLAIQLLWLNIVTDGLQDFALSFESAENNIMQEKPISTKDSIFNSNLFSEVIVSSLFIGCLVFGLWFILLNYFKIDINIARGYIMVLMVFIQNIHVFNCRSEKNSSFSISIKKNPLVIFSIIMSIILQIIVIEEPLLSKFLKTTTIPYFNMFLLLILSFSVLLVMEIYKLIKYK